ncbi:MAG: prepilin-type N-terminal cleavage/methylation domain-containing protein [Planctomycetota bacterium]|nr:prepilin-type N-terminal cleavage/methylation domain-containing protein [Planctomycetota bacterium]
MRLGETRGFTLIEVMIVVGIIAVIAAIGIPSLVQAKAHEQREGDACEPSQLRLGGTSVLDGQPRAAFLALSRTS